MFKNIKNDDDNFKEIDISQLTDEELDIVIKYLYKSLLTDYSLEKIKYILGDIFSKVLAVVIELESMKTVCDIFMLQNNKKNYILFCLSLVLMGSLVDFNNLCLESLADINEEIENLKNQDDKKLLKQIYKIKKNHLSNEIHIDLK